jgi:dihydrofolate synthase/folylpolyglutamate synthase
MMDYEQTLEYLFNSAPLFQNIGAGAYKEGLTTTETLDNHFGNPHRLFKTIHVAGTNGKGSCSHTIAAILQAAGYKVGLYTSPHLVDFRERIRVNGTPVSRQYVIDFVEQERNFFEPLHPSFFELTTAMAFKYFAEQKVDMAVIEVGLGGRLDCTNIIRPEVSIITNISFDHIAFLGNTLEKIAGEKAGIIKQSIPVVIGETQPETEPVFRAKAQEVGTDIYFADQSHEILSFENNFSSIDYRTEHFGALQAELSGDCQTKNMATILTAIRLLQAQGWNIGTEHVRQGVKNVCETTGLMGRWQILQKSPLIVTDTAHNVGGFQYIAQQLRALKCQRLHIVIGMVNDKDIHTVLSLLPQGATYYFTQASVKRALAAEQLKLQAAEFGLEGETYPTVAQAYQTAVAQLEQEDALYIGGSNFIVADLLAAIHKE